MNFYPAKIGIIGTERYTTNTIQYAIQQLGHQCEIIPFQELVFEIDSMGTSIGDEFDCLFLWTSFIYDRAGVDTLGITRMLEALPDTTLVNSANSLLNANHKGATAAILSEADDVPVPISFHSIQSDRITDKINTCDKLVQKPVSGGGGNGVSTVENVDSFTNFEGPSMGIFQQFIDTGFDSHRDVRAFVVGDEVIASMERTANGEEWRTNISQGGSGEKIDLSNTTEQMAVDAVDALGAEVGGVDLIKSEDGPWFVLEVNVPAGFKELADVAFAHPAATIAEYLITQAGWDVDSSEVENLSVSEGFSGKSNGIINKFDTYVMDSNEAVRLTGQKDTAEVEFCIERELENNLVSVEVADEIGVGHVHDMASHPEPNVNTKYPVCVLNIMQSGAEFKTDAMVIDISDYDYNFYLNSVQFTESDAIDIASSNFGESSKE